MFESKRMDIHLAKSQLSPWYRAINPNMTVPSLIIGDQTLTDSCDILHFAASAAGHNWLDADPRYRDAIQTVVQSFYRIPIENLTFGKAMVKYPLLRKVFPKALRKILGQLRDQLNSCADPDAVRAKIHVNEQRLAYFTQGSLADKLAIERQRVGQFLKGLPAPKPDSMLFGNQTSSADVVCCVLLGRLKMIGEYQLVTPFTELDAWFTRMQATPNFAQADIWMKFRLWRILLRR